MDITNEKCDKLNRYLQFLAQDPDNLNLLLEISNGYRLLNDFLTAQLYLDRAKAINADACLALEGILAIQLENFNLAKESLQQALKIEDFPALRYSLAVCHYHLHELNESIDILNPLLTSGEPSLETQLLMAQLLYCQGRFAESIKLLQDAIEQYGPDEGTLVLLAQLYFDNNDLALAKQIALQVLIINPSNYEAQVTLMLLRLADGDTTISEIKKLLQQAPADSRLWFALGTTYLFALKLKRAEKAFLKAAELDASFSDNWVSLGWCQLFLDKPDEAQNSYQQLIAIDEKRAEGWGGLALITTLRKEFATTSQLIAKAKALNPECLLANIAQILYLHYIQPEKAAIQFNQAFPKIREQITAAMAVVLQEVDTKTTLH